LPVPRHDGDAARRGRDLTDGGAAMEHVTKRQIVLLRVAQRKLGLSDAAWRTILAELAGVASTKELDRDGFDAVLACLEWRGFRPAVPRGPDFGTRPGMATPGQVALIRELWFEYTARKGTGDSLNTWLLRSFKVSALRFLTCEGARKAIAALKAMKARARQAA
jgi:hypothetical protein